MNLHLLNHMKSRVLTLVVLVLLAVALAYGQPIESRVILSGTVYDQIGNTLAEAKVIATNEDGRQFETTTNEDGSYELMLPVNSYKPGGDFRKRISMYNVKVLFTGFKITEITGLKLVTTKVVNLRLDAVLEVGLH